MSFLSYSRLDSGRLAVVELQPIGASWIEVRTVRPLSRFADRGRAEHEARNLALSLGAVYIEPGEPVAYIPAAGDN